MNPITRKQRILGVAFLFQAIASLVSGAVLLQPLVEADDIADNMAKIADNTSLMRAAIVGDVLTAMGIIFLGGVLFVILRKQNELIALVALGLYIMEAALLAVSRIGGFALLRISEEYVESGHPADLETAGQLALEAMDFGYTLHMLPFCFGAMLFYFLLYRAEIIPSALALWGLITVPLVLVAILFTTAGQEISFFVYLPYAPFEFVVGAWILVRGISMTREENNAGR